jgi:hypothetical protein
MIVRELVTRLGFEIDDKNLIRFNRDVQRLKDKLSSLAQSLDLVKKAVAGVVVAGTGLSILTVSVAKSVQETENLAKGLGITTSELQELELIAQSTGAEVGDLTNSFTKFNKALADTDNQSSRSIKELKELGISLYDASGKLKDSKELYRETAKAISSIENPAIKAAKAQRVLGINNLDLLDTLTLSNEEFDKQREKIEKLGYIIDSKGIRATKEFIKSWRQLNIVVDGLKTQIALKFMPVLKDLLDRFNRWYEINRKIINDSLGRTIDVLSTVFNALLGVIKILLWPVQRLSEALGGFDRVVIAVAGAITAVLLPSMWGWVRALSALTVALLANPITWFTVAVGALGAAIALLVEDIYYWVKGNDSALGRILGRWEDFKASFKAIIDSLTGYVKSFFDWINKLVSAVNVLSFDGLKKSFAEVKEGFKNLFSSNDLEATVKLKREKKEEPELIEVTDDGLKIYKSNSNRLAEINPERFAEKKEGPKFIEVTDEGLKIYKSNEHRFADEFPKERSLKEERLIVRNEEIIKEAKKKGPELIEGTDAGLKIYNVEEAAKNNAPTALEPIVIPEFSMQPGNISNKDVQNNVTQNITENITVNVPTGTSSEQQKAIADQITAQIQEQFNQEILRGMDSLGDT